MAENDAHAATIRDYMKALLRTIILETEEFSGKRPFGNSGWDWDMHAPLVTAGLVRGPFGKHDDAAAQKILLDAVKDL